MDGSPASNRTARIQDNHSPAFSESSSDHGENSPLMDSSAPPRPPRISSNNGTVPPTPSHPAPTEASSDVGHIPNGMIPDSSKPRTESVFSNTNRARFTDEVEQMEFQRGVSYRSHRLRSALEDELEEGGEQWDQFESNTDKGQFEWSLENFFDYATKGLKVVMYFIFFAIILGGIVMAKAAILAMLTVVGTFQHQDTRNIQIMSRWVYVILFAVCFPYFLTFVQTALKIMFGSHENPSLVAVCWTLMFEAIHSFGLSLLLWCVLPKLDIMRAVLLMAGVGLVPSFLSLIFSRRSQTRAWKRIGSTVMDALAFLMQLSAVFIVIFLQYGNQDLHPDYSNVSWSATMNKWEIPLALICISFKWRENFYNSDLKLGRFVLRITDLKETLYVAQVKLYFLASALKVVLMFGFAFALLPYQDAETPLLTYSSAFDTVNGTSNYDEGINATTFEDTWASYPSMVAYAFLLIGPAVVFYISVVSAQLKMQCMTFSLATTLSTPVCVATAVGISVSFDGLCWTPLSDSTCFILLNPTAVDLTSTFLPHIIIGVLCWWVSQMWITRHIWFPSNYRLEKADRLFVLPNYCAVLLEQSLIYNRRKDENIWRERLKIIEQELEGENVGESSEDVLRKETTPTIYICATMWHENRNEMLQMLKSVFRLDEDQATRKNARELLEQTHPEAVIDDPDYYEFEGHIMFDDAMTINDWGEWTINTFVKLLINTMNQAATAMYNRPIELDPPVKIPTPYGGRLVWTLPGENLLIVHLKDKNKIRHRKRWSQIMYMYYLLGYRLLSSVDYSTWGSKLATGNNKKDKKKGRHVGKAKLFEDLPEKTIIKAENTFLLALDGDVDFKPKAVQLLVDRLKRNKKVGVVCGRIRPIGSGPMVWYQQFEYAIAHWLQKAAEHVLGCVLCSPGCFSMFRGSALIDDNVLHTYTTPATEALHYMQYDQGEDRWLSTLLLQQGYRIEYVAASDALTYAPESFNEFFNQRRRWGPSTMANTVDLLLSWKSTIHKNDNISFLYMLYQGAIFCSSILGPATIMLMIAGAFDAVLLKGSGGLAASYLASILPVAFFIIICFFTKSDTQISVAAVMSAGYGILMIAVLIATIVQIAETSLLSPSGIFLVFLTAVFITTGLLHPQELFDLAPGLMYYITIPSGYLLLIIYGLVNMNNVSWGTREVITPTKKLSAAEVEAAAQKQQQSGNFFTSLLETQTKEDSLCGKIGTFFRQCCSGTQDDRTYYMLKTVIEKLEKIEVNGKNKVTEEEYDNAAQYYGRQYGGRRRSSVARPHTTIMEEDEDGDDHISEYYQTVQRDDLVNPAWLEEPILIRGNRQFLEQREIEFWDKFIRRYLKPIDKDVENEKKIANDLKEMRNNVCLAFFMVNVLWIAIIFMISLTAESLQEAVFIPYYVNGQRFRIEPIGLVFLSIFGVTLIMQYIGMLLHRWSTLRHIMATTYLDFFPSSNPNKNTNRKMEQLLRDALRLTKDIQRFHGDDEDDDSGVGGDLAIGVTDTKPQTHLSETSEIGPPMTTKSPTIVGRPLLSVTGSGTADDNARGDLLHAAGISHPNPPLRKSRRKFTLKANFKRNLNELNVQEIFNNPEANDSEPEPSADVESGTNVGGPTFGLVPPSINRRRLSGRGGKSQKKSVRRGIARAGSNANELDINDRLRRFASAKQATPRPRSRLPPGMMSQSQDVKVQQDPSSDTPL